MKVEITIGAMYSDPSLGRKIFRAQSYETFETLVNAVGGNTDRQLFDDLEDRIEYQYNSDFDNFEEDCYNNSVEELLDYLGYETE